MSAANIVRLAREGNVAVVTIDNPPVNTITAALRSGLAAVLDEIGSEVAADADVKAVVLICAGNTFCSGADIGEFNGPPKEAEYRQLFGRLEGLDVPVIAAMHGTVLGGGLELGLASHYRIAAPGTRFGLPEVTLGIFPGAGGTQRLPRLIGVEKALDLILDAKPVDAAKAVELGFIDNVVEGDLRTAALAYANALIADGRRPRRTRDLGVDPATGTPEILENMKAKARKLYPNRSAGLAAVDAVAASLTLPFDEGLLNEDKLVNVAKASPESKGAVHVFFAERETRKVPDLPADAKARPVAKAAIIGAGTMGRGIAIAFADAGIPVTLVDTSEEALAKGIAGIDQTYASMVKRGRLTEEAKGTRLSRIDTTLNYADLAQVDVVIEAVFESMELKKRIFAALDKVAKPGAVLATNTSTLDVEEIGSVTSRPQDVIGMHFFSPANVMPLLEVVRTTQTSPETIRTVLDLSRPLRKTPVLAKVCYGFVGNRMMEGYAREAERMVLEGARPAQIDKALEDWGMAMGILAVFDMAGVDVGVNVHKANADKYPPDPTYYQADLALVEAGRLGQKNGKGYYRYVPGDRVRHEDEEAIAILAQRAMELQVPKRTHTSEEIVERCLLPLINDGFRILEEGIVQRAADIDVVWTSGYGFPRYRGGPMHYAETLGLANVLAGIDKYRALFGPMHWQPAPLLVELARSGRSIADWERSR